MVYLLYDILVLLAGLGLLPYYLLRGVKYGKTRRGIRERLGFYPKDQLRRLAGKKVIWIHAVSVGETRAAMPLIRSLKKERPDYAVVLSHVTETGREIAAKIPEVDLLLFFPFDLSCVVKRVLRKIKPDLIILIETEIWPNFVRHAQARQIPVGIANGRISDRSFPRYLWFTSFLKPLLENLAVCCMQSELDAGRIHTMGARLDRVVVTGNVKFDMEISTRFPERDILREELRLAAGPQILVAGSTHSGEENMLFRTYRRLLGTGMPLLLIVVPRHPERAAEVAEGAAREDVPSRFRSQISPEQEPMQPGEVLIVDTLGEMLRFYHLSDLVFVGGSLVPVGGHNLLEASLMKKPVLFGPHTHNFKEITKLLLAADGGRMVPDEQTLQGVVARLLGHPDEAARMGEEGFALIRRNAGATGKTLDRLLATLADEP